MVEVELNAVTLGIIKDLEDLRAGKITNADARTRAQLAREVLRAVSLNMQGMKIIEAERLKAIEEKAVEDDWSRFCEHVLRPHEHRSG